MFTRTAQLYDLIYRFKNYEEEVRLFRDLVLAYKQTEGRAVLDVACGTGQHAKFLKAEFEVEGLDLDDGLLDVARRKNPELVFHHGDMTDFDLGRDYDVVACLFSAIAYSRTPDRLKATVRRMAAHTRSGGLVIFEAWAPTEDVEDKYVATLSAEDEGIKLSRMSYTTVEGRLCTLNFHFLVGTDDGVEYMTEQHELGLFEPQDYQSAVQDAGLELVHFDPLGWTGRAIYVGRKP